MSSIEGKINNIETFPHILREHLKDALKEAVDGPLKNLENFDEAIKQLYLATRKEVNKLRGIARIIDINSAVPRNLDELYKNIEEVVGEVGLVTLFKKENAINKTL